MKPKFIFFVFREKLFYSFQAAKPLDIVKTRTHGSSNFEFVGFNNINTKWTTCYVFLLNKIFCT